MIVVRCTQKLLKNSAFPVTPDPPAPTAPLGEWYANAIPLHFRGKWVVMYTSSECLLTIVVPGRALSTTLSTFQSRAPALLRRLQLPFAGIALQERNMVGVAFARTASRSILGSMNDLANHIQVTAEAYSSFDQMDLDQLEVELSEVPLGALQFQYPREVARAVLQRAFSAPVPA
jgi:hypothetical protein